MTRDLHYIIVLRDGETWDSLEGCTIIGMSPGNERALGALDAEDIEGLFEVADVVVPLESPAAPAGQEEAERERVAPS